MGINRSLIIVLIKGLTVEWMCCLTGDVLIMAELPELIILAGQMDRELQSKEFHKGELRQEKSLNLPVDEFIQKIRVKMYLRFTIKVNGFSSSYLMITICC